MEVKIMKIKELEVLVIKKNIKIGISVFYLRKVK